MRKEEQVEHVLLEKIRIGKLSRIRELVFGAQDGLLVPLGVVSSVAGAFNQNHIVIIAGISEALAGAFSMGTGAYLASQAERQVHDAEIVKEEAAIRKYPEKEQAEMALIFEQEGLDTEDAKKVAAFLSKSPKSFATTMIQKELGLDPDPVNTPIGDAAMVGLSYLVAAGIPLFPYFFLQGGVAIITSILATFFALFLMGLLKGKVASLPYLKSGFQVLAIGAGSGIGGYLLGSVLPHILGLK